MERSRRARGTQGRTLHLAADLSAGGTQQSDIVSDANKLKALGKPLVHLHRIRRHPSTNGASLSARYFWWYLLVP
jgi:hypothetical protein